MATITDLLRLTQWLSPAFPLSGYAYSHGLETAMAEGRVTDAASCRAWTGTVLRRGTGALDAWAIRRVMTGDDPEEVADVIRARAGCAERWAETRDMGAAFDAAAVGMGEAPGGGWPLPVALATRARGMEAETVAALYLQALAAQIVSAATRFLPLGQTEAQAILRDLHPLITEIAARDDPAPPGGGALLAELDAMAHETLQPRIFRT
ncbi:urease accessory protein UreF [Jannaschia formosa]|uniref:urease accessory protein UreF n=1 Tax=Jannaschia formosa TaxID=2259592 RepID=UPI000E1BA99F|nr:urease accessory UreF family protein [Jannaschia formosa]TFL18549.1 urease accessory protein UreF [Jannaschia formosa]